MQMTQTRDKDGELAGAEQNYADGLHFVEGPEGVKGIFFAQGDGSVYSTYSLTVSPSVSKFIFSDWLYP